MTINTLSPLNPAGRRVSAIFTGDKNGPGAVFFERLAQAGGGDFVVHRGQMIESVLLSVFERS